LKITKEVKVAVFVVAAGTCLYTGFNFLKGIDLLRSTKRYYSKYANVNGLKVSNAVMLNGLAVGRVSEIKILADEMHTLQVQFDVDKNIVLGDSSKAIIASSGLLGDQTILLHLGAITKPVAEETFIKGEVEQDFTTQLSETVKPVVASLKQTMLQVNTLLADDNLAAIAGTLKNMERTSVVLNRLMEANANNILATTGNLNRLTTSLVETEKQLKPLLVKTNAIADSVNKMQLAATIATANKTISELNQMLNGINKGEGTLGQLAKNDSLYVYLKNTSRDLDLLLVNLREKPGRYVHLSLFGRKDK